MSDKVSPPKTSWVIGRAADCDLIVPESTVGSHHCRLTQQGNGFLLEDLNSLNHTFLNGVQLLPGEPVQVQLGANVTLGKTVAMPWPTVTSVMPNRVTHVVPNAGRTETVIGASPKAASARRITIGRSPESDVHIDLPIVSSRHAEITIENGQYILRDLKSLNGTSIGELNNRITAAPLDPSSEVFLGSYKISAAQLLSGKEKIEIGDSALRKVSLPRDKPVFEIGRDPQADVPLDYPMISWRHARVTRVPEGMLVEDLASRNGTYVDGVKVSSKVLIKPGQEIGLGSFRFQLLQGGELALSQFYGNVTIEAKDIVVCAAKSGERLLDPISFTIFPSELVAVMGSSGAGKTTLLKALNGYTRPTEGTVLFNRTNLYDYYDRFRQQMGYVPQDDILHPQLTAMEALYFSARLRTDMSDAEIKEKSRETLLQLGLSEDDIVKPIGSPEKKVLSGGQRKRVNIALELITETPVLFLDEPTSGLSSQDADSIVALLKRLAKKDGKTIVTTIHQPSLKSFKQFDDLIMVSRDPEAPIGGVKPPGTVVFFGPAYPDSIQFFNPRSPAAETTAQQELEPGMLLEGLEKEPKIGRTAIWRQRFLKSRYQQDFVAQRAGKQPPRPGKTGEENARRQFGFRQWAALVHRNVLVKIRDQAQTRILLLQAPFFAVLVCLVINPLAHPLNQSDVGDLGRKLGIAHFLMVVAAIWFGCNNAARDIVGEWTVYKRERMITLKLLPYVFSKLAVLLALCVVQCGLLIGIVNVVSGIHGDFLSQFLVLLVSSIIGAGLGLSISAFSRTTESAVALLPVVLLPIIALAGGMRPIHDLGPVGETVSRAIPSRWAFEANLLEESKANDWKLTPLGRPQFDVAQFFFPADKVRHEYQTLIGILCLMLALSITGVVLLLWRRDKDRD